MAQARPAGMTSFSLSDSMKNGMAKAAGLTSALPNRQIFNRICPLSYHLLDLLDNLGVGQGHDVTDITVVGNGTENAPHDLAGAGLGHIRNDPDLAALGDLADLVDNGVVDLLDNLVGRFETGFQRDIEIRLL